MSSNRLKHLLALFLLGLLAFIVLVIIPDSAKHQSAAPEPLWYDIYQPASIDEDKENEIALIQPTNASCSDIGMSGVKTEAFPEDLFKSPAPRSYSITYSSSNTNKKPWQKLRKRFARLN